MKWSESLFVLTLASTLACEGTSTGNPMTVAGGSGGSGYVPDGAELLRSNVPYETDPQIGPSDATVFASGNRAFAFDLYRVLSSTPGNVFVSPFSISVALAMAYPGAEALTEAQIGAALHFELPEPALHSAFNATLVDLRRRRDQLAPESTGNGFELALVNQAWGQRGYPFLNPYLEILAQHYDAGLFAVNFAESEPTRQIINGWVQERTADRIRDLLPADAITSDTRLVLTNAIYFKASWLSQFDVAATIDGVFHTAEGDRSVSMMQQTLDARYADGGNYQALELPYLSPSVRMFFILPADGQLDAFSAALNDAFFQEMRAALSEHTVTLALPKFEFEFESALKGPLSALGMPDAFGGEADFTAIAGGVEHLFIADVYHKAFIAVDEEGTEAAAATATVFSTESEKPSAQITFDRPFVFAIYDEPTGQILFLGHLNDPG